MKRNFFFRGLNLFWVAGFAFLPLACTTSQVKTPEVTLQKTSFSFDQQNIPFRTFSEYRVRPGDRLEVLYLARFLKEEGDFRLSVEHTISVKFVHNPELNETQKVRPDGKISLAYLDEVIVAGKTVAELTKELQERYSTILAKPEVYVVVNEFRSRIKEIKADLKSPARGLSRLATVRPDGYITVPLLGDIFVVGETISTATQRLNQRYEEAFPGLQCALSLEKAAGSWIYVLGQVQRPGVFSIRRPMSVVEAIALAGSYVEGADLRSVIVIRRFEDKLVARRVNVLKGLSMARGGELFFLQPDDIIYVPKTWIKNVAEITKDIADALFFDGWSLNIVGDIKDDFKFTL